MQNLFVNIICLQGNECREGRAQPFDAIPKSVSAISGHKECLKMFQATDAHQDSCLPLSRPDGCTQEAFDALQALAFQAQLPRDARQSPLVLGALPPAYLTVEGHRLCLGSHQVINILRIYNLLAVSSVKKNLITCTDKNYPNLQFVLKKVLPKLRFVTNLF
jgi:hypothetical protein